MVCQPLDWFRASLNDYLDNTWMDRILIQSFGVPLRSDICISYCNVLYCLETAEGVVLLNMHGQTD